MKVIASNVRTDVRSAMLAGSLATGETQTLHAKGMLAVFIGFRFLNKPDFITDEPHRSGER